MMARVRNNDILKKRSIWTPGLIDPICRRCGGLNPRYASKRRNELGLSFHRVCCCGNCFKLTECLPPFDVFFVDETSGLISPDHYQKTVLMTNGVIYRVDTLTSCGTPLLDIQFVEEKPCPGCCTGFLCYPQSAVATVSVSNLQHVGAVCECALLEGTHILPMCVAQSGTQCHYFAKKIGSCSFLVGFGCDKTVWLVLRTFQGHWLLDVMAGLTPGPGLNACETLCGSGCCDGIAGATIFDDSGVIADFCSGTFTQHDPGGYCATGASVVTYSISDATGCCLAGDCLLAESSCVSRNCEGI